MERKNMWLNKDDRKRMIAGMKLAKRSAANRKAWRTRKRMKAARLQAFEDARDRNMKLQEGLRALHPHRSLAAEHKDLRRHIANALEQARQAEAERSELPKPATGHNVWPAYMTRALPNPWSKDLPPW